MSKIKKTNKKETTEEVKLNNKDYERELAKLHGELVKRQQWVVHKGLKI